MYHFSVQILSLNIMFEFRYESYTGSIDYARDLSLLMNLNIKNGSTKLDSNMKNDQEDIKP